MNRTSIQSHTMRRTLLAALLCFLLVAPAVALAAPSTQNRTLATTATTKSTQKATTTSDVIVYRLYNGRTGEHLYTLSDRERRILKNERDWFYEGVAWRAPAKSKTPVYRLYNTITREHLYTANANERRVLLSRSNWNDEGIAWYSDDKKTLKVQRLYSAKAKQKLAQHHYTLDTNEVRVLTTQRGWTDEGVAWYATRGRAPVKDAWVKAGKNYQWWDAGVLTRNRWVTTAKAPELTLTANRELYRIDANGYMKKGLFTVNGKKYFANPSNGQVARNTYVTTNSVAYYADDNGVLHEKNVKVNSTAGKQIAAAAVALSGTTQFVRPPGKTYNQRLTAVPPNKSSKGNWTLYNKVYPKINLPYKAHAHCGTSVRLAVMWAGADDKWDAIGATRRTYDYLNKSKNWKMVGSFSRQTGVGVALQPGDVLLTKRSAKGEVGHIAVYVGKTAAQKKYKGTPCTVFESGGGGYWPRLDKLIRPGGNNTEYYVYRCTTTKLSSKYSKYYASERNRYLP